MEANTRVSTEQHNKISRSERWAVTTQTQHGRHARTRTAVTSLSSPRWNSARCGAAHPFGRARSTETLSYMWSGRAAATGRAEAKKRGVRDAAPAAPDSAIGTPAPVAVASRERMRLCRRARASHCFTNARPARSVSRATENNPRVDRRDRRCESWSLGGARRLLSLISGVRVPFPPHLHATDMLLAGVRSSHQHHNVITVSSCQ
jgi:hypothetical protein